MLTTRAMGYLNSVGGDVVHPSKMLVGFRVYTDGGENNKIIGRAFRSAIHHDSPH